MRKKKDLPLVVLEALTPFFEKKEEHYKLVDPKKSLLKAIDTEIDSGFFFEVENTTERNGNNLVLLSYKPKDNSSIATISVNIDISELGNRFNAWSKRIIKYNSLTNIYDDPILRENEKRFFQQFDIVDEDADYASFDFQQQLFLDEYLEKAKTALLQLKEGKQDEEIEEIEDLIQDVEVVRQSLSKETKRQIIKRLSRFWGKAQKVGLPILKEVFVNVATELTKRLLTGQ